MQPFTGGRSTPNTVRPTGVLFRPTRQVDRIPWGNGVRASGKGWQTDGG
jgi:hypothetical protein